VPPTSNGKDYVECVVRTESSLRSSMQSANNFNCEYLYNHGNLDPATTGSRRPLYRSERSLLRAHLWETGRRCGRPHLSNSPAGAIDLEPQNIQGHTETGDPPNPAH